jgi:hypothetical protein
VNATIEVKFYIPHDYFAITKIRLLTLNDSHVCRCVSKCTNYWDLILILPHKNFICFTKLHDRSLSKRVFNYTQRVFEQVVENLKLKSKVYFCIFYI